ncbi:hypothetical protein TRAPUB_14063 [Trametes pubescens]|uniref:BTB domain-containing protein n=1 Tax=Trametes pubescens TaxID=154538 RepID=A0A1M2VPI7_TRAPU|nr:hypothetical protein TRAPUB_14063 [Trametes pubescens]
MVEHAEPKERHAKMRDAEFWFRDGNIVLVARDVDFRVYKGILADQSPVFDDMFSFPQPAPFTPPRLELASSSNTDACPFVHLSDSPEDLRHLLRVCMPKKGMFSPFQPPADPSYASIAAAARLGHKYQMTRLFEQALNYLKTHYTNDFEAWEKQNTYVPRGFADVEAIGVVNLARFLGETNLLTTALFACCQLGSRQIISGFAREDGTREQLTLDDIGLCLDAKPRLVQESVRVVLRVLRPIGSRSCTTATPCRSGFRHLLEKVRVRVGEVAGTDPFLGLFNALGSDADGELCRSCWLMAENRDSVEKRAVWDRLPEILGLAKTGPGGDGSETQSEGTGAA